MIVQFVPSDMAMTVLAEPVVVSVYWPEPLPAALSILTTTFAEGAERNKAMGVWGAVAGSGGAVGVLLGGILTETLGWEWVLFVNVPIPSMVTAT